MTDNRNTASDSAGKKPSHVAYHVRDGHNDKGYWTPIGAAWASKDQRGFTLQLHCVPLDGRIVLRVPDPKE